jgi:3-methyladenine DNA glycosylase AlkD
MDPEQAASAARALLAAYDPAAPGLSADALRELWRRGVRPGTPGMSRDWGIDVPGFEAVGTPVPVLEAIGREAGRLARRRVDEFLPLARLLWDGYGREGRIVAAVALGPMELAAPETVVPVLYDMAQTCVFWEDCDQLAMRAVEPVLRRDPATWLEPTGRWITDANKWVRRAGLTAVGRLAMKQPACAARCVELLAPALGDPDNDVKRALSFGLRVTARADVNPLKAFILAQAGRTDVDSLWVLCDAIRSMTGTLLPQFVDLLPLYRAWLNTADAGARRSIEGAIRVLESVAGRQ